MRISDWSSDVCSSDLEARGSGLGQALLAHLAKLCAARDCARLEWSVLDWNAPSIGFYKGLGARMMDDWTVMRVDGAALAHTAGGCRSVRESHPGRTCRDAQKNGRKACGERESGEERDT